MVRRPIPIEKFIARPQALWGSQWPVLTAGDFAAKRFNSMTVGWGSLGLMWGIPFAQVVVRPHRYTFEFMEAYETFTLSVFPEKYRPALQILGSTSGRDGDKIAASGLTPQASTKVAAPGYAEAELILECRKIYWDDMDCSRFLDPRIEKNYPKKDYHRIYYGEILAVYGAPSFGE